MKLLVGFARLFRALDFLAAQNKFLASEEASYSD
jgi:hypothetical protein